MTDNTSAAPATIYLKDYKTPLFNVESVNLDFQIFDGKTIVTSTAVYVRNRADDEPLKLNGEGIKLLSVSIDGQALAMDAYTVDEHFLTLEPTADKFTLTIEGEIEPEKNEILEGLYKSGGTYCTQCEAEGFRRITYWQDRPDVMTSFTVRIEADKAQYPILLSNGNMTDSGDAEDGRHFTVWEDPHKKPCYLFALVAAELEMIEDNFTTASGRDVTLRIYANAQDIKQCDYAMDSLKRSMTWDEEVYGREYDLDLFNIVAVGDFNAGAMENKSLNIFNTALVLAHHETASDSNFARVESVVAHEYFHNWTGNRVTCRDWFQLSLKEGLTVFRDQEFSADQNSRAVQRIEDVQNLRAGQFPEDAGPMAHPIRPDNYIQIRNFYTATVYEKGAEIIRMFHTILGAETYRKATDLYFERHDGQAVTCEDWIKCMEDASGRDLTAFKRWYHQAGTPTVEANGAYDDANQTYTLTLTQKVPATPGQPDKLPVHIPVAVGLLGPDGKEFTLADGETTQVLHLTESTQTFMFENISAKPVPSILRNFSAPVILKTDVTDEELRFLMVHDTDGFNRWEAGQELSLREIHRILDGEQDAPSRDYLDAFSALLEKAKSADEDKALMAFALGLPGITVITNARDNVNPTQIHAVRQQIIKAVAEENTATLEAIYADNTQTGDFRLDGDAIAERSLKNTALAYLCKVEGGVDKAVFQYETANNMTDRVAALSAMNNSEDARRDACYIDFYHRFKDYPLVVDKWFTLQAFAVRESTLKDVKDLRTHKDFNIKNPNRMRALIAGFAMGNPVTFHDASGEGYQFLTDAVIELQNVNPQVAARTLAPLQNWKKYTPDRQQKMKACLEQILEVKNLSSTVYEVVSKSLL